jgi:hypothetical protein
MAMSPPPTLRTRSTPSGGRRKRREIHGVRIGPRRSGSVGRRPRQAPGQMHEQWPGRSMAFACFGKRPYSTASNLSASRFSLLKIRAAFSGPSYGSWTDRSDLVKLSHRFHRQYLISFDPCQVIYTPLCASRTMHFKFELLTAVSGFLIKHKILTKNKKRGKIITGCFPCKKTI